MDLEAQKRAAAEAAIVEVREGMRLGLGTGSTARYFVDLVGERVAGGLNCLCVPTSEATAQQARLRGIPLTDFDAIDHLDLVVDGADEIDSSLNLIKGGGAALLREKIVAVAADRMVVIADSSKEVTLLGRFPLPVEVNRFGLGPTKRELNDVMRAFGAVGGPVLRLDKAGVPLVTDGGHLILDASFGRISAPEALSDALLAVPGVVQHGLFLDICATAYIGGPDGVKRRDRLVSRGGEDVTSTAPPGW
jgi:ribose 5-phosphate isomerase A